MEKQYSEWAVSARESLTTWKETKQTQPKGDLKDTKIWASFQPFYKTFLCEFWVQNCSSIFTLSVCLSVTHPDVHLFWKVSIFPSPFFFFCVGQILSLIQIFSSFYCIVFSLPQNKYFPPFPFPLRTKYLFLLQIFCSFSFSIFRLLQEEIFFPSPNIILCFLL